MKVLMSIIILFVGETALAENNNKSKQSYSVGFKLGEHLHKEFKDVDNKELISGLTDAIKSETPMLSKKEIEKYANEYQVYKTQKIEQHQKQLAAINQDINNKFIKNIIKDKAIKKVNDGLYYRIIKPSTGKKPTKTDIVKVHYTGKLINGEIFDSTVNKSPISLNLSQVIKAWQVILPMMSTGSKWTIYASPEYAYGKQGIPGAIPPNSLLIFDIELIDFAK